MHTYIYIYVYTNDTATTVTRTASRCPVSRLGSLGVRTVGFQSLAVKTLMLNAECLRIQKYVQSCVKSLQFLEAELVDLIFRKRRSLWFLCLPGIVLIVIIVVEIAVAGYWLC